MYRNNEGYADNTAGQAIVQVSKEEKLEKENIKLKKQVEKLVRIIKEKEVLINMYQQDLKEIEGVVKTIRETIAAETEK